MMQSWPILKYHNDVMGAIEKTTWKLKASYLISRLEYEPGFFRTKAQSVYRCIMFPERCLCVPYLCYRE